MVFIRTLLDRKLCELSFIYKINHPVKTGRDARWVKVFETYLPENLKFYQDAAEALKLDHPNAKIHIKNVSLFLTDRIFFLYKILNREVHTLTMSGDFSYKYFRTNGDWCIARLIEQITWKCCYIVKILFISLNIFNYLTSFASFVSDIWINLFI